jgi:hypothetical protein
MPDLKELSEQVELLQQVVRITRDQLNRAMALASELEAMLLLEKAKVANLTPGNFTPDQKVEQPEQPAQQ